MMTKTIFRSLQTDKVTTKGQTHKLEASTQDCSTIAKDLNVISLRNITADITAQKKSGLFSISGALSYDVEQKCVVSLSPVITPVEEKFEVFFYENDRKFADDSVMDKTAAEQVPDGIIDLGLVVQEQIAISLPDYPRAQDAHFESHIEDENALENTKNDEKTHRPFATLLQDIEE